MKYQSKHGPIPDSHFEKDAPANPGAVDAMSPGMRKRFDAHTQDTLKKARELQKGAPLEVTQPLEES